MSAQTNEAIVRRFIEECINGSDLALLDELIAPNYAAHVGGIPFSLPAGPEGWRRRLALLRAAFPDGHMTVEDLVAAGDKVVVRYRARGTHCGPFWGIAPTGKMISYTGIVIMRLREGRLVEEWAEADLLGLTQQLAPPTAGD